MRRAAMKREPIAGRRALPLARCAASRASRSWPARRCIACGALASAQLPRPSSTPPRRDRARRRHPLAGADAAATRGAGAARARLARHRRAAQAEVDRRSRRASRRSRPRSAPASTSAWSNGPSSPRPSAARPGCASRRRASCRSPIAASAGAPTRRCRPSSASSSPRARRRPRARRATLRREPARAQRDSKEAKFNVVPNPALAQAPRPVAPTLVQAAPGATTTVITRRPAPPAHQQSGHAEDRDDARVRESLDPAAAPRPAGGGDHAPRRRQRPTRPRRVGAPAPPARPTSR